MLKRRKEIFRKTHFDQINKSLSNENASQSHENNDNSNRSRNLNNIVRQQDAYNHVLDTSSYHCDIEDDDEFQTNSTALLQHYVIVWASILSSPKG